MPFPVICVIFFARVVVFERLRWVHRGVRGGCSALEFFFPGRHISGTTYYRDDIFPGPHDIRWFFSTWFFADGFLFPVKELGFWTNPGHWVRVLDAAGSYMYIVL
jgi:hypothetical protein